VKNGIEMTTINVSIPTEVLKRFDEIAQRQHWGRSTLIRLAVEGYIQSHWLGDSPEKDPK
jgi:metal-responsive CopG/Arc/MetJ family transcriptional regulator